MRPQITKAQKHTLDLEAVRGPSSGSTTTYRAYVKGFTRSGHPQTVEGFASYIASITGKRPAASVNLAIAAGKAAFLQAAIRAGMDTRELTLLKGALSEIPTVRRQMADVKVVTPEERARLFVALPLKVRLIAETLYQTGARVSEIVGLRRERVKVNGNAELRLFGKGSKERQATITLELYMRILQEFPEGEYLFTTREGNPFARSYVTREINRASRRVLGRKSGAHVLRHSRATDLIESTGKVKGVSRMLGHASEATTLRFYVKQSLTEEELSDGV